jgi:hypothetical protein
MIHQRRVILVACLAICASALASFAQGVHAHPSDFAQIWHAGRALLQGENPYDAIGPGRAFDFPFPFLYPLPAVIVALPLTVLPLAWANICFVGLGAAALAWAVTARRVATPHLCVFLSIAYFEVAHLAQWSPLIVAAVLTPSLGFLLACKPTIGAALFAGYPNRRSLMLAAVLVLGSVLVYPSWPRYWLESLRQATHFTTPVMHLTAGGPLLLLALLKWRRPEARILAALACVPHTMFLYEAVPLFIVVRNWYEGLALAILTIVVAFLPADRSQFDAWVWATGHHMTLLLYMPCLVMVLRRPNVRDVDTLISPHSLASLNAPHQPPPRHVTPEAS